MKKKRMLVPCDCPGQPGVRPTVREMLDMIDNFLVLRDGKSKNLWAVLSALRGPDNRHDGSKFYTTEVIRSRAFPKTAGSYGYIGASFADRERKLDISKVDIYGHFGKHIVRAAKSLRMRVETNP